jgi:hypothetical protein
MGRQLSDDYLLETLAGFLAYEAKEPDVCFWDWAEEQGFSWSDRAYVEAWYMSATLLGRMDC